LCLTDNPYGCNYQKKDKENYKDELLPLDWFNEAIRITNQTIFTSGQISMFEYPKPNVVICWYKPACCGHNTVGGMCNWEPFLYYGKTRIPIDVIKSKSQAYSDQWTHSSPKPTYIWSKIIDMIKPKSILDCFIGSGVTIECAEKMGIPWLGFEIMEAYAPDIEKRIQLGMKAHDSYKRLKKKQLTIFSHRDEGI
jgi:hypothetical protein